VEGEERWREWADGREEGKGRKRQNVPRFNFPGVNCTVSVSLLSKKFSWE